MAKKVEHARNMLPSLFSATWVKPQNQEKAISSLKSYGCAERPSELQVKLKSQQISFKESTFVIVEGRMGSLLSMGYYYFEKRKV